MVSLRASIIFAGLIGLSAALAAQPGSYQLPEKFEADKVSPELQSEVQAIGDQATRSARQLVESGGLDWLDEMSSRVDLAVNPLQDDAATAPEAAPKADPTKHPLGDGFKTFIFVSWSLGDAGIKSILSRYDGVEGTAIVFRGIPEGQSLAQGVMAAQALSMETKSALPVLLDPIAFKTHGITSVPAVAIENPDGTTLIKGAGTYSTDRLRDALEEGTEGDMGLLGPTVDIHEPDLIEVAQQKMAELDLEAMKQKAIDRFWHRHTGHPLPTVMEDAERRVDPTVIIHQDIVDAQGNVVTPAGEINPLDLMPFDQKLIIIDPEQSWQVALAADEVRNTRQSITVTVMATRIDPDQGWELFENTQEQIDAALYLLPPDMASRFQIAKVPSIVTADSETFIVTELSQPTVEDRLNGL